MELNKIYNEDCLEFMRTVPDNYFDLIITDPPYGIGYGEMLKGKGDGKGGMDKTGWKSWDCPEWDKERPSAEVFKEMQRVSKNQVIWGGKMSRIFTEAEMLVIEERKAGNFSDKTGLFSARIKPKIKELLQDWIPKKKELNNLLENKR